jgi:hypothetical protein
MSAGEKHAMLALKWTSAGLCTLNNSRRCLLFGIAACRTFGSMETRVRYLEKYTSSIKRPQTEWQWVTVLDDCDDWHSASSGAECVQTNGKLKYGVLFLVIFVFHISFAITVVSQGSVMAMQCVFWEVGSDFLNVNSVNLRFQTCKVMRSAIESVECNICCCSVCGLIVPSTVRCRVTIIM